MDNNELLGEIAALIEQSEERTAQRFTRLNIKIENEVAGRIDALFDGYKLTHEKQYELEREFEALKHRMERLEMRVTQAAW